MRYLSVCSGIEAATVAWHPLGWKAAAFSEIEPFPRKVLKHHYPEVPIHGDFTTIKGDEYGSIDLLVGGTPCQSFSVAGLRRGLDDDRGNLALEFLRLADRARPRWVVWENVPGVLSSNGGRDFGSILGGLVELGYGFAYRVLDAQHFGVPQRRRRVFVVGHLGDWRRAAAVLFERHSLSGHPAPRREARQGTARGVEGGATFRWQNENDGIVADPVAASLRAKGTTTDERSVGAYVAFAQNTRDEVRLQGGDGQIAGTLAAEPGTKQTTYIAQAYDLRGREGGAQLEGPHDTANIRAASGGSSRSYVAFSCKDYSADATNDISPTLRSMGHADSHANGGGQVAVAFQSKASSTQSMNPGVLVPTLDKSKSEGLSVIHDMSVRRLTPRECERLQGFPDDYTLLGEKTPDGPRYKALGNSMAVPVMRWIGERIDRVNK